MPGGDDIGIQLQVEVEGEERLQSWLLAAPIKLLRASQETVREGVDILGMTARAFTPVRTGWLQASTFGTVRESPLGAVGVLSWAARYGRFPEHGTKEHGRAQRYALHTAEVARPTIDRLFDYKIRSAL